MPTSRVTTFIDLFALALATASASAHPHPPFRLNYTVSVTSTPVSATQIQPPPPPPPEQVTVLAALDAAPTRNSTTIATIEVDVMPFLGRESNGKTGGGPHNEAFHWLGQLGADMVRFAPWFPNPGLVVAELHPPNCSRNYSSWNVTLLDAIYADFAAAVGEHSVAMQLSTLPGWMFSDGMPWADCDQDPWAPCMSYGRQGIAMRDPTCGEAARYIARLVGWFTQGGATDECGTWHPSGHHHKWALLSVLNEVQHEHFGPDPDRHFGPWGSGAANYTKCYDAIVAESRKVYPDLKFVGPELGPEGWDGEHATQFLEYFLDGANHADGKAPDYASFHYPAGALCGAPPVRADSSAYFQKLDCWITGAVADVERIRQRIAPKAGLLCNEIYDGDGSGVSRGKMIPTASWNLAASWFGYAVGNLAEIGVKVVGQDQLAGGPSPDNSASVSCLDWATGRPNAKYYSIQMVAAAFGVGTHGVDGVVKTLYKSTNTSAIYALPFTRYAANGTADGVRRLLLSSKLSRPMVVTLKGGWCEAGTARVLEAGAGPDSEPGFDPPVDRAVTDGVLTLGAYALATVECGR